MTSLGEKRYPNNIRACLGSRKKRQVACALDIPERTLYAILNEESPIPNEKIEALADYLGVSVQDLFRKKEFWNVPYQRNLFFTGREAVLEVVLQIKS